MVTEAQEAAAFRKMPKWQQQMIREAEAEDERKCGIPVRKVSAAYIKAHAKLLDMSSAFTEAGDELRQATGSVGRRGMTRDDMVDLGIYPLMSSPSNPQTRLGQVNGDYVSLDPKAFDDKRAQEAIDRSGIRAGLDTVKKKRR